MLNILVNIGYLILLINLILFILGFPNQGKAYKIFTWYTGIMFIIQISSNILIRFRMNNLFLSHFYFVGQFILLSFFYFVLLKGNYQKNIVKIGLLFGLSVLGVQYGYDTSLFLKFNLFEIFITSILLIVYAAFHFYNMLNEKKEFYYINVGILMYLFGSTVLFLVGNLTASLSLKWNKIPWILNAFLYVIYQIIILIEWKKSFYKKEIQ